MAKRNAGYLLAAVILALSCWPVRVLEVSSRSGGEPLFIRRAAPGDEFEVDYVHSVEKIPVKGVFAVTAKGAIRPRETVFSSFGAGLPFRHGEVELGRETMRARVDAEDIEELSFFVSGFTRQQFRFKGQGFAFSSRLRDGDVIVFRVKRYPLGRLLVDHVRRSL
jgi:hypothetical protein